MIKTDRRSGGNKEVGNNRLEYKLVPSVSDYCSGCGDCIRVCPHQCLELHWDFAKLTNSSSCTGNEECVDACSYDAIQMIWKKSDSDRSVGRWRELPPQKTKMSFLKKILQLFKF